MAILNFNTNICNYTTKVVSKSAIPGSLSINNYEYVDLEMIPDTGYYLPVGNFSYEPNDYIEYVTFMQSGTSLRARAYLKQFDWPEAGVDVEVLVSGCAEKIVPTTTTTAAPIPTTTTTSTTATPCPYISGYFINKNIIEDRGENRLLKVYGISGAIFTVSVTNSLAGTVQITTATIAVTGSADVYLNIPRITSGTEQYTVTISASQDCTLQLQTQPKAFKLFQGEDIRWKGDTFECVPVTTTTTTAVPTTTTTTAAPTTTTTAAPTTTTTAAPTTTTTAAPPPATTTTTASPPPATTTTAAPTPTLTCAGTGFNLLDGTTGATITSSDYTITNGTVTGISPSTYQGGSNQTYNISILVPAGYTNTGSTLNCTDTATGTSAATTTTTAAPPPATTTTTAAPPPATTTTTTVAPTGTLSPDPITAFTPGVSNSTTIVITANANWTLLFRQGAVNAGFSFNISSGSSTGGTNVTVSYDGSSAWTTNGEIELRSGTTVLDTAEIQYSGGGN